MINFNTPINNVSFGHVGLSILHAGFRAGIDANVFPIGSVDVSAYSFGSDFLSWLGNSVQRGKGEYSSKDASFKLWHLSGAESQVGDGQSLITFHELSKLTPTEINIAKQQKNVFVTSRYTEGVFRAAGVDNVKYLPLGFDSTHFKNIEGARSFQKDGNIVFGLFGKWEKRKHTEEVIRAWVERFGGKQGYKLNLNVTNPFFNPQQNQQLLARALDGKQVWNVNPHPYLKTLNELNYCLNACDIVIDMSGGEGFSIPSFSATALGKHAILSDHSSLKDWGPQAGGIMVPTVGMEDAADGVFFHKGGEFNQGEIAKFNKVGFYDGCDEAIMRTKLGANTLGLGLKSAWTWDKTVKTLVE